MKKSLFIGLFIVSSQWVYSQLKDTLVVPKNKQTYVLSNGAVYAYKKPKFFDFVTKVPKQVATTFQDFGTKNNLTALGISGAATIALLPADQYLLEEAQGIGAKLGMESVARFDGIGPLYVIPTGVSSSIYLIGDGITPILISTGLATYGWIQNDYRSLSTASNVMEGLLVCGVFSQTIKRISGRQSPTPAMEDGNSGGDWHPFPSFSAFASDTPNYDAFPSGHLMTATATLYILMGNYPEKKWLKPVGFTLLGALSFQMVQSSVHWVSDYPLALVMGYIIGKNIVKNSVEKIADPTEKRKKYTFNWTSSRTMGFNMIGCNVTF